MQSTLHEQILAHLPDGISVQDREFTIIYQNKAMERVFGCHVGDKCYTCYEHRDGICEGCGVQKAFQSGEPNMVLRTAFEVDGTTSYWENSCFPLFDSDGNIVAGVEVCRNITDRVSLEEDVLQRNIELGQLNKQLSQKKAELQKARDESERLLASMSSFLIELDENQCISRWNSAAEMVFDSPAQDVIGKKLAACNIQWDWESMVTDIPEWPVVETPVRWPEVQYRRTDGAVGFLSVSLNPIKDNAGRPQGCFLLGMDITERRTLQQQLNHAQKLQSVGRLAAGLAHEINTPIQYVGDNIEFLQIAYECLLQLAQVVPPIIEAGREAPVPAALLSRARDLVEGANLSYLVEQVPRAIEQSIEGVGRVATIVQAMKEFSHPGSTARSHANVNQCIQSTVMVSRNEWKYVAELELDLDPTLPGVLCVASEFNQVILAMIVNAAHAIADVIEAGAETKGTITIRTRQEGDWAVIEVADTGSGMSEEIREQVFDPFFTTKEVGRGTGQGLAISRNIIVDKHGGAISVASEVGKGTTFTIRLPIEGAEMSNASCSSDRQAQ